MEFFTSLLVLLVIFLTFNVFRYKNLSEKDLDTGCYNSHWFKSSLVKRMKKSQKNNRNFGLLFIDIDDFKYINDSQGHDMGDLALVELVKTLKAAVRRKKFTIRHIRLYTDYVVRCGGDEFIFVVDNVHKEELQLIGVRVLKAIRAIKLFNNRENKCFGITASIGGTIFTPFEDDVNVTSITARADRAMYNVKNSHKNSVHIIG